MRRWNFITCGRRKKMAIQISIDRNIINNLNEDLLRDKVLPVLRQGKIIIHLTDPFLRELLLDDNRQRKAKHSEVLRKIFNGKIIHTLPDLIRSELASDKNIFYDHEIEERIKELLDNLVQKKPLGPFWGTKVKKLLEDMRLYNEDLKTGQEGNLKKVRYGVKIAKKEGAIDGERLKKFTFEEYYNACIDDLKIKKLICLLEANKISYRGDLGKLLRNKNFPCINFWLRIWFAYHYYTFQRGQPTLRRNDASDLDYLIFGFCLDYFVTDDIPLSEIGNLSYNASDKFISWEYFESKLLKENTTIG